MLRHIFPYFLGLLLTASGCASSRILRVENKVLIAENNMLQDEIQQLRATQVDPKTFSKHVNLKVLSTLLTTSGYQHDVNQEKSHIHLKYAGKHTQFGLNIQYYEKAKILFIATNDYFGLDKAMNTSSVVLLAVKLMALNYEMLLGKRAPIYNIPAVRLPLKNKREQIL